jgi:2-oxoglutarate dehydrogenase E2 component (dihydrolipoamide succinyltransferase)
VITRWLRQDGDAVTADEPVLELETDKAMMEIPAGAAGRLEIVEPEGSTVRVGTVVARIAETGAGPRAADAEPASPAGETATARDAAADAQLASRTAERAAPAASPAAARPARPLEPSAPADERAAAAARTAPPAEGDGARVRPAVPGRPVPEEAVERVPMTRLRQRIAERLVEAQRTAAILTTFNEIDCHALREVRARHRERFRSVHGVDLGLMSLFGRAVVLALADVPPVNARIDGGDIVYHRHVHLGIAVSTPRGLVVPVVRHAHAMTIAELERAIGELAAAAREGRLTPDQLAGGTFSITNGGVFGSLLSTPILNPPQPGILGMHRIQDRPVALDGQVVIRPMMYVALSYDHRLVDGEQAVTFLVRVKERLEDPIRLLLEV